MSETILDPLCELLPREKKYTLTHSQTQKVIKTKKELISPIAYSGIASNSKQSHGMGVARIQALDSTV